MSVANLDAMVTEQLRAAAALAPTLAGLTSEAKHRALSAMGEALQEREATILAANQEDVAAAVQQGDSGARVERLTLSPKRIQDMVAGLSQVAELPDPIGEVIESFQRPNGLDIEKVRVPLGVLAVIYESRPNVTVDSAALALKTGNAVVLRGGKEALRSNLALVEALRLGLTRAGISPEAIQFIQDSDRRAIDIILSADHLIDVVIPRGGAGLIQRVKESSRVPVIETGVGNCHVYVHADADLDMATEIIVNAKTQRPSVCNAIESVLIDRAVLSHHAPWFARLVGRLQSLGVTLKMDAPCLRALREIGYDTVMEIDEATDEDYATEFLALTLSVKCVENIDEALRHIRQYGTRHSECIVTKDVSVAERFLQTIDAAAVYHNASTRFTDGFEFGYGAEIGISTQKLHARGPMGLRELCSYKYMIRGTGQIRS